MIFVHRNLGHNDVHLWDRNLTSDLALEHLDLTNNFDFSPDRSLLRLKRLKEIVGVTWCQFCKNCTVANMEHLPANSSRKKRNQECLRRLAKFDFLNLTHSNDDPKTFVKNGYLPECLCKKDSECEFRQIVMPYFKHSQTLPQRLFYFEYALGPLTIILNIVIILVILFSRNLRQVPSFILIINMAVGDVLVGIYSVWVAHVNITNIHEILEEIMWAGRELRPTTGPIFIAVQLITVFISLLLTIERYMVIVYCMKPNKRLHKETVLWLVGVAWSLVLVFATLPVFGVGGLHYNIKRACTPMSLGTEYKEETSAILLGFLVLILVLYTVNIPPYIHIFLFVKRSTLSAGWGVKRDVRMAARIAVLILVKFLFFAVPIILILVSSLYATYGDNPFEFGGDIFKSTTYKVVIGQWLPVTCLCINSFLDPFLYAYRNGQFQKRLKKRLAECRKKCRSVASRKSNLDQNSFSSTKREGSLDPSHSAIFYVKS